jgi:hypothetical protein
MRKAVSTPAIHFKGSGWAKKDARAAAKAAPSSTSVASTDTKAGGSGAAAATGSEGKAEGATVSPPTSGDRSATTKSTSSGSE